MNTTSTLASIDSLPRVWKMLEQVFKTDYSGWTSSWKSPRPVLAFSMSIGHTNSMMKVAFLKKQRPQITIGQPTLWMNETLDLCYFFHIRRTFRGNSRNLVSNHVKSRSCLLNECSGCQPTVVNLCWLLVDLFGSSSQPSKNKSINFELWICFDFLWSGAPPSKNESNRSLLLFFDVCWSGAPPSKNKSACIMLGLFNPCLPLAHVVLCPYPVKSCLVTAFLQSPSTVVVLLPTQCLPAYLTGPLMFLILY